MGGEGARDQFSPFRRQVDYMRAAVAGIVAALNQPLGFQAIDCGTDRSAGEPDGRANRVYGHRSFVQKHFQDREIREAQTERGDIAGGETRIASKVFHSTSQRWMPDSR
jgi:hypothetical protein